MLQINNQFTSVHHQVLWLHTAHQSFLCVCGWGVVIVRMVHYDYTPFSDEETGEFLTLVSSLFNIYSLSIFLCVYPSPLLSFMLSALFSCVLTFFVCVCVSVYMDVCVHSCVCLHMPLFCVYVCEYLCMRLSICVSACVCVHLCVGVCVRMSVCGCVFLLFGQVRRSCRMMSLPVTFSASCSYSVKDTTQVCMLSRF